MIKVVCVESEVNSTEKNRWYWPPVLSCRPEVGDTIVGIDELKNRIRRKIKEVIHEYDFRNKIPYLVVIVGPF
jgi:hypothetical protein